MRLFTAIELPDEARSHLARLVGYWREHLDDDLIPQLGIEPNRVSWVPDDNLHVTLKFLGDVSDQTVPTVCAALVMCIAGCGCRRDMTDRRLCARCW